MVAGDRRQSLEVLLGLSEYIPPQDGDKILQEPHGVTSQKTAFFIVTAMKTSNLT
jgi:hypothetical protein